MQYPTTIQYYAKDKSKKVTGQKKQVLPLIDKTKTFPSRSRAKKFIKDHPLKNHVLVVSEGKPIKVKEEE